MKYSLFIFLFLLLLSCEKEKENHFGNATMYYPYKNALKKGIVNKYYVTRKKDKEDNVTYAIYKSMKINNDTLKISTFNAGFQLQTEESFLFENNIQEIVSSKIKHQRKNKIHQQEILESQYINWSNLTNNRNLKKHRNILGYETTTFQKQLGISDTLIDNVPCKIIIDSMYKTRTHDSIDTKSNFSIKRIFTADRGLTKQTIHSEKYTKTYELVEQFFYKELKKRSKQTQKRVGYIDPKTRLDKDSDFSPCHQEYNIHDYYNGDPDAGLPDKQGTKWNFVDSLLKKDIIQGESGILSVRFIVNCKGETGYFTYEESDLNYQKHAFKKQTIDHLVTITRKMGPWEPTIIWGEPQDSYAYVMYKIKNGEITDILP